MVKVSARHGIGWRRDFSAITEFREDGLADRRRKQNEA